MNNPTLAERIERLERLVLFLEALRPEEFITERYAAGDDEDLGTSAIPDRNCAHCTLGWLRYHHMVEEKQGQPGDYVQEDTAKQYYFTRDPMDIVEVNDVVGPDAAVKKLREYLEGLKSGK